jgi:acetyltransferase
LTSGSPGGWLAPEAAAELLAAYRIRTPAGGVAHSAEEAVHLAESLVFQQETGRLTDQPRRVALKIVSPDIPHKSDIGGVLLDLPDAQAVRGGFDAIMTAARSAYPQAELQGVYVQEMISDLGQEVILGAVQDAQFGPLVMFGSGGVEVEGLRDVAFGLAPLTRSEADRMLASTWAGRKLDGYRSLPPADRQAVLEALLRLAQLAADALLRNDGPELIELEINPLRVLPPGRGAVALDVRARLSAAPGKKESELPG